MNNVLILDKISEKGLSVFDDSYNYSNNIQNPDAILLRSTSLHDMQFENNLLTIGRAGAGVNNIPIEKCSKNGIVVFNTPGANANAVKELTLAGLFLASRRISDSIKWIQSLNLNNNDLTKEIETNKKQFKGPEIMGKSLGVIGLGAIGALVANSAQSLGMKVLGFDPYISVETAWNLSSNIKRVNSIDKILENCDYITIHVPLNDYTKNIINANNIKKMKDGVRLLNFSRAGLVNQKDIVNAIKSKKVLCYVTDFPTNELLGIDNIITIPHLGASTPQAEDNCAYMAASEVKNYIKNGNITNSVNFPNLVMPNNYSNRLCVLHKNIPGMIKSIAQVLAEDNVNIENMQSKSKNDYAYAVFDVSKTISNKTFKILNSITGTLKIRVI